MAKKASLTAAGIALGSIYLTLQNVLSTLIGVLGYAYMARVITLAEMGVIAGVTLLSSLTQIVLDLGLNSSIAKFTSEEVGRGADYSKYLLSALTLRIPLTLAVTSQIALFSTRISEALFNTPNYSGVLSLAALDIALLSISPLLNNTLWGSGRLREMAVYGFSSVALRWAFITAFLHEGLGLTGVVYGWIVGDSALLVMLAASNFKKTSLRKALIGESIRLLPSMLRFSWPIYIGSITSFLYAWYDKALILAFLTLQQLGVYNTAYTAFSVLASIATSLGSALLPYYGMAYGKDDHEAVTSGVRRAGRYTMLAVFPLTLGLAATAKPTITLFAGQQYEQGWPVLAVLSVFGLVYGLSPAFSNLLLIYGKTKTILLLNLTSVAISLIMLPTVKLLGLVGLAVVRGASLLLTFLLSLRFISEAVRVEIDGEAAWKALAVSIVMALIVLTVQQVNYSSLFLPVYVAIGASVYIAFIRALKTINQEDVQLIKEITGQRAAGYVAKILGACQVRKP